MAYIDFFDLLFIFNFVSNNWKKIREFIKFAKRNVSGLNLKGTHEFIVYIMVSMIIFCLPLHWYQSGTKSKKIVALLSQRRKEAEDFFLHGSLKNQRHAYDLRQTKHEKSAL